MPFRRRRTWTVAASVLAAAAVVVLAVWVVRTRPFAGWFGPSTTRPELAQLVAAVGDHRPVVPRLTGGFAYGPPPSPMRGSADREVPPDVRIAAAEIEKLEEQHDTPQNEGALGVAYLVSGEVDKAVQSLEDAVAQEPGNGDLQSDLAAAYLVQATREDRAEDYPKALTAAERAIKANPSLIEAWFNRALALEALSLTSEAKKAWQDYLKHDPSSKWAEEAKQHLAKLSSESRGDGWDKAKPALLSALDANDTARIETSVRQFGQETRELVENELLPDWGKCVLAHDEAGAARELVRAERLAVVIARLHPTDCRWTPCDVRRRSEARLGCVRALRPVTGHSGTASASTTPISSRRRNKHSRLLKRTSDKLAAPPSSGLATGSASASSTAATIPRLGRYWCRLRQERGREATWRSLATQTG